MADVQVAQLPEARRVQASERREVIASHVQPDESGAVVAMVREPGHPPLPALQLLLALGWCDDVTGHGVGDGHCDHQADQDHRHHVPGLSLPVW